jgi:maltooligosyltrehalose trehalohydrolase
MYRLDGGEPRPDPAARFQPAGVHGPSQVVDPGAYDWSDKAWRGVPLEALVIYELHVGTATESGTFDALIGRLDDLRDLGVTAIELMPLADFPGQRNWGYDGVSLFAPARPYGDPDGLKRLVDAAHARGLAVILDVVYNHLGPDGNYLRQFSQAYFTDRHKTPWGDALNFDGPGSGPVRAFFLANACYWANEYHVDGLRLDATHAILDDSPLHILAELAVHVRDSLPSDCHFVLIAENENNDPNLIHSPAGQADKQTRRSGDESCLSPELLVPPSRPGLGLDAVWADDLHHQLRVALAGDHEGYYQDYAGTASDIATTLRQGWFYTGQPSAFLGHPRGAPADDVPPPRFVHCIQNHDQVGNRALGERLNHDIPPNAYRAASTLLLLSPYTPLLWMGQEWAASTPFLYFTDHNPELGRLVTEGRRSEFAGFTAFSGEQVPDPQALETFLSSKLRWDERAQPEHAGILRLYRDLFDLRRHMPALQARERASFSVEALGENTVALRRAGPAPEDTLLLVVNLRGELRLDLSARTATCPPNGRIWSALLDSEDTRYGGSGEVALQGNKVAIEGSRAILFRSR